MENITFFTLFSSSIIFGFMVIMLAIALIVSDIKENGFIAFLALVTASFLNYFWGTFPLTEFITIKNTLIYLFLGFLFSLLKTYIIGKKLTKTQKQSFDLKSHVFRWIALFPICLITWLFGDLLESIYNVIYSKLSVIYETLFNRK